MGNILVQLSQLLPFPPDLLLDAGFAVLLFLGVMAIMADRYAELALAGTVFTMIWLLVQTIGRNMFVALLVLVLILAVRVFAMGATTFFQNSEELNIVQLADSLLSGEDDE